MLDPGIAPTVPDDPLAQVFSIELWMPARLAPSFLRAFSHDVGGKVLEDTPAQMRVLLGRPGMPYARQRPWPNSWLAVVLFRLGLASKRDLVEMTLVVEQRDAGRHALRVTVVLRPHEQGVQAEQLAEWRSRALAIYTDLHAYLLGSPPREAGGRANGLSPTAD
jgi:hypothetical protein